MPAPSDATETVCPLRTVAWPAVRVAPLRMIREPDGAGEAVIGMPPMMPLLWESESESEDEPDLLPEASDPPPTTVPGLSVPELPEL